MKQITIILFLFASVFADSDSDSDLDCELEDCKTWPKSLKSVRECCNLPIYLDSKFDSDCNSKCLYQVKPDPDCATKCYVNNTKIVVDNQINSEAVKKIYYQKTAIVWKDALEAAIEKCECEFDSEAETLSKAIVGYYNCINEILAKDCKSFQQCKDCLMTEEHYKTCQNVSFDCSKWNLPDPMLCCKVPQLVTLESCDKCKINCGRSQFLPTQQQKCVTTCSTGTVEEMVKNGTIDFELVKKILKENVNNTEKWEKAIETAVESCQKFLLNGLKHFFFAILIYYFLFIHFSNIHISRFKTFAISQSLSYGKSV
jgi:hypothetical protein